MITPDLDVKAWSLLFWPKKIKKSMYDTGVDYLSAVKITLQQNEIFE